MGGEGLLNPARLPEKDPGREGAAYSVCELGKKTGREGSGLGTLGKGRLCPGN